jgi:uncharacterized phage-associated protein
MRVATVFDVAAYILGREGAMTALKLQKLVYYAQAWSLAWTGRPLFPEPVEAWERGPVVRTLWEAHRGQFLVECLPQGDPTQLDAAARDIIDAVLSHYGHLSPDALSELTHQEAPWRETFARGGGVIDLDTLRAYYARVPFEQFDEDGAVGDLFYLRHLLARVTPANRHAETETGAPRGREVW